MRTNIEWKTILDIIDQAILVGFFGEKAEVVRPYGIRGAIELASIQEDLDSEDTKVAEEAQRLIVAMASKLEEEEAGIRNAIANSYEDVQVEFLRDLWGETAEQASE